MARRLCSSRNLRRASTFGLLGATASACSLLTDLNDVLCPKDDPTCASSAALGGTGSGDGSATGGKPSNAGGTSQGGEGTDTGGTPTAPVCETGFPNDQETACCHADCETCGGLDCGLDPLGAEACCAGTIIESGSSCGLTDAPCYLINNRCPEPGELVLEFQNGESETPSDRIRPHFRLFNQSAQDVEYKHLEIRYYFTEDEGQAVNYSCTLAFDLTNAEGCGDLISGSVENLSAENTNSYLDLTFSDTTTTLMANKRSPEFKGYLLIPSPYTFNQSNDYSFSLDPTHTGSDFAPWDKVTLYCDGQLMHGREPN